MTKTSSGSLIELSISRIVATVLALVFVVEYAVMFLLLPAVLPANTPEHIEALVDASALTVGLVPLLWIVIVRPLRMAAVGERARAAAVVSTASDGIITMDRGTIVQTVNPAVENMLGWSAEELIGQPISKLFADVFDSAVGSLPDTDEFDSDGVQARSEIEMTGIRPDGTLVPLTISLSGFHYSNQRYLTAIVHDMTERKRAEEQLASRARQQSVVAELGRMAVAATDFDELLADVVERAASTLNLKSCLVVETRNETLLVKAAFGNVFQRAIGRQSELTDHDQDVLQPSQATTYLLGDLQDASTLFELLQVHGVTAVTTCVIEDSAENFGSLVLCHAGSTSLSPNDLDFVRSLSNVIGAAIQRDRAETELREKETVRAGQMELLAQVATGVAHEIRNPLTSIKMICQTLAEEITDDNQSKDFEVVTDEILRMERSLNVFLDYARPPETESRHLDLAVLLERSLTLTARKCEGQRVEVVLNCPERPLTLLGDSAQLQQVLLNLSLNALAVMPHGGRLEISAHRNAGCIRVAVRDSGPGVPAELKGRIFDPFFTTKETGVGLGLVISRRIAIDHGGTLELESTDSGAKFVLTLPSQMTEGKMSPASGSNGQGHDDSSPDR